MNNHTKNSIQSSKILLCGFYGCGNFGDDALLLSILPLLRKTLPDSPISCLVGKELRPIAHLSHIGNVRFIPRMHPAVLHEIATSDLVLLGGGSVLQNQTGQASLLYYLALLRLAQRFGKKTAILAGGLGPIDGTLSRMLTASVLKKLDHASFRDRLACAFARHLGATDPTLSADPALLLMPDPIPPVPLPPCFLLISLKRTGRDPADIAKRIAHLAHQYQAVPLFCDLFPKEDAAFTRSVLFHVRTLLQKRKAPALFPRYLNSRIFSSSPPALLSVVMRAQRIVTGRYHLALFARLADIPCTVLGDDPKLSAIASEKRSADSMRDAVLRDLAQFQRSLHAHSSLVP